MENNIDLYLFTYNCNKRIIHEDLFIPKLIESFPDTLQSLYVFGLQEFCTILDSSFELLAHKELVIINKLLMRALTEKYGAEDVRFQTCTLANCGATGIVLITPYPLKFSRIRLAEARCGYANSSLKGAICVRILYTPAGRSDVDKKQVELTFASAHLPAYEGEYYYRLRNSCLNTIMRALDFGDGFGLLKPGSHTFFMGDLNYRTSKNISEDGDTVRELISLQNEFEDRSHIYEDLLTKYDELSIGRTKGEIFTGFSEACINFRPTYKYNLNTAIYNPKRSPSWCDRILYQSTYPIMEETKLTKTSSKISAIPQVHEYRSLDSLLLSDHQPVYLSITIPFEAPKSIISSTGYLKILPTEVPHSHDGDLNGDRILSENLESISGPTQIYMKPTKLDHITQFYLGKFVDICIGYCLWFGTTPPGRLTILGLIFIMWILYLFT